MEPGGAAAIGDAQSHKSHLNAYLDNRAYLLKALIELMQADFQTEHPLPQRLVILAGPANDLPAFQATLLPTTIVLAVADNSGVLPPTLARPKTAEVNAYVCQGVTCLPPLTIIAKLQEALKVPIVSKSLNSTFKFPGERMKRLFTVLALAGGTLFTVGNALAIDELHKKYGCTACHLDDKKLVGPAYKEVAAKYKTDKDAVTKLSEKVRKGGMGVWGQIPMPPNAAPTDAELKTMIEVVLKTK